jgi:hypothetical protein
MFNLSAQDFPIAYTPPMPMQSILSVATYCHNGLVARENSHPAYLELHIIVMSHDGAGPPRRIRRPFSVNGAKVRAN